jgi:hypothetical protein
MDAFSEASVSDNWNVDKDGPGFMPNICVCFGLQSVLLTGNLSFSVVIFSS